MLKWLSPSHVYLGATGLLAGGLLIRLWMNGLIRQYPWFCRYLLAEVIQTIVLSIGMLMRGFYPIAWAGCQLIMCGLYVAVVREFAALIFHRYPGIATFSRRFLRWAFVLTFLVGAVATAVIFPINERASLTWLVADGVLVVTAALVGFLFLFALSLLWFPLTLTRNDRLHFWLFFIYFLGYASGLFLLLVPAWRVVGVSNLLFFLLTTICLVLWGWKLAPAGNQQRVRTHAVSPEREAALLQQLEQINSLLSRAATHL